MTPELFELLHRHSTSDVYVVFTGSIDHPSLAWWWRVWSSWQSGPTHCYPMRWTGSSWVSADFGTFFADVDEISLRPDLPELLVERGARVVAVTPRREERWYNRGLISCVSVTKMILGLRGRTTVITPTQLLKCLLADGGREVLHGQSKPTETIPGRHCSPCRTHAANG